MSEQPNADSKRVFLSRVFLRKNVHHNNWRQLVCTARVIKRTCLQHPQQLSAKNPDVILFLLLSFSKMFGAE